MKTPLYLSLMELQHNSCRFPYGERDFTFCGHPKQTGSAFCPEHHAIVYTRATQKDIDRQANRVMRIRSGAILRAPSAW